MPTLLPLETVESQLCDFIADFARIPRNQITPHSRLVQDLNIDSLEILDLFMQIEVAFNISLPQSSNANPAYKAIFTRKEFRISDLAELVYLQKDLPAPENTSRWKRPKQIPPSSHAPFTHLSGILRPEDTKGRFPLEPLEKNVQGFRQFRRITDGMICVELPNATVTLGSSPDSPFPDELPQHQAAITSFLIDIEPVSTTAYCRFLNSITPPDNKTLHEWFLLPISDRRHIHQLIHHTSNLWHPIPGTERFPMVLVSWHGANAYANWANQGSPLGNRLPTEAQWEYAARATDARTYPWGNQEPDQFLARFAQYERGKSYTPDQLPFADVNAVLGVSPFGLRHMAGNIWQWCDDFYSPTFYNLADSVGKNPQNNRDTGIRSERGGSWIGPAFLCRSCYRRGRIPSAKGRCLGFRCISHLPR